ncbi:uncharacterized protein LOC143446974 [Clavelina lepadiformis]|uniref:uncharacterized protein LOC143446974 n=1 Tax=Clavelina lepadiformis TaxID=159417 RepID=UPI0040420C52
MIEMEDRSSGDYKLNGRRNELKAVHSSGTMNGHAGDNLQKETSSVGGRERKSTLRPAKETKTISGSQMSQATPNPQAKKSSSIDQGQFKNARSARPQANTETTKPKATPLSTKYDKQAKTPKSSKPPPKKQHPNNTQPRKQPQKKTQSNPQPPKKSQPKKQSLNNSQPSKNKRQNMESSNKNQHHTKAKTNTPPSNKTQSKNKSHQKDPASIIASTPQPTGDATVSNSPEGSSHALSTSQQETKTKSLDQACNYLDKARQVSATYSLIQQVAKGDLDKVEAASQVLDTWHAPRTKAALQTGVAIKQCYDGDADVKETATKIAQYVTKLSRRAGGVEKLYNGGRDLWNGNGRYACYDLVDGSIDLIPHISSLKRLALAGLGAYNGDVDLSEMTWAGVSAVGGPVAEICEMMYGLAGSYWYKGSSNNLNPENSVPVNTPSEEESQSNS